MGSLTILSKSQEKKISIWYFHLRLIDRPCHSSYLGISACCPTPFLVNLSSSIHSQLLFPVWLAVQNYKPNMLQSEKARDNNNKKNWQISDICITSKGWGRVVLFLWQIINLRVGVSLENVGFRNQTSTPYILPLKEKTEACNKHLQIMDIFSKDLDD